MSDTPDSTSSSPQILRSVERYYTDRVRRFGPTARGADWNSEESQELRFAQLLTVCAGVPSFSLLDYGCGYGALASYLDRMGIVANYVGFDLSDEMIRQAEAQLGSPAHCRFTTRPESLEPCDFVVASGIFNVRLETGEDLWRAHVLRTLEHLNALGTRGFAFNMLTSYSDADRMREDLYYGNPLEYFDHCKRTFSRHVALLHDYGLYEFTIRVHR